MSLIQGIEGQAPDPEDDPQSLEELEPLWHGKHKVGFVKTVAANVLAGMSPDAAKLDAIERFPKAYDGQPSVKTVKGKLARANKLLEKTPALNRALQKIFEDAGLSVHRAVTKQVELIDHENPEVAQRGLNTYFNLAIPKPTQRHQVQSLGIVQMISGNGPPEMDTRTLDGDDK